MLSIQLQEPHFKNIVLQAAMLFALSRSVNALEGNVKCSVIRTFPNSVPVNVQHPSPFLQGYLKHFSLFHKM